MPNLLQFETPFQFSISSSDRQFYSSHRLCSACECIFVETRFDERDNETVGEHHETVQSLKASAAGGCQLCFMILTASRKPRDGQTVPSSHSTWRVGMQTFRAERESVPFRPLHITLVHISDTLSIHSPEFPENYVITKPVASNSTGSKESLAAAKRWLFECRAGHAECNNQSSAPGWLPTRLIDVGSPEPTFAQPMRLRLREEIAPGTSYLTLSHRWTAETERSNLRQASLAQFRTKIPEDALSTSYKEVMDMVRCLGYQYIWIDSLCIVQDSHEDWQHECSHMGDVYRNGDCNLWNDLEGTLFSSRDPKTFEVVVVRANTEGKSDQWVVSYYEPGDETLRTWPGTETPLYKRGWVIQEWYMARRILHFGDGIITWECCEGSASEAFPSYQPGREVVSLNSKTRFSADKLRTEQSCMDAWHTIIRTYTEADLTVPGDKLPAISAVAKDLGRHLQNVDKEDEVVEYLGGLWSPYFVQQLLWESVFPNGRSRSPAYQAPSWSWASSLNVQVTIQRVDCRLENKQLVDILDRKTYAAGDDCFQQLVGGYIKLRGWLWKICPSHDLESNPTDRLNIQLDDSPNSSNFYREDVNQCFQKDTWLIPMRLKANFGWEPLPEPARVPVYFMCVEGLVLNRDSAIDNHFTRAGIFSIEISPDGIVPTHALEGEDPWAVIDKINAGDLRDILEPTIHHADKLLGELGFDADIHPSAYEERIEDPRFSEGTAPHSATWLYTITLI